MKNRMYNFIPDCFVVICVVIVFVVPVFWLFPIQWYVWFAEKTVFRLFPEYPKL